LIQKSARYTVSVFIILLAALFSALALHHARRWHPDEAFYMTIARNAAVKGDWWLLSEPLDKPPLTTYTNAVSLILLAVDSDDNSVLFLDMYKGEFAGRIPSLLMSVVLVAVVMALAKTFYGDRRVAWAAATLVALSPLRIVFASTAFTDMPMLLFATISLWMAARGKWGWSGVWFMVSIAAKPQSLFYLPLIGAILIGHVRPLPKPLLAGKEGLLRFALPVVVGIGLLWVWDGARIAQGAASFWAQGQANYTPLMLTPLSDYPARIAEFWASTQYLFGHRILTAFLLVIGATAALSRRRAIDLILLVWLAGFLALHVVFTLNLFDRNLIVILPVAAVMVSRAFIAVNQHGRTHGFAPTKRVILRVGAVAGLLCLSVFSFFAAKGAFPIGGDDGRHDGIDQLATYLNSQPLATVIYDPWLDWELDYYMGDWTNKRRVFYPNPTALVGDALALNETGTRLLVAPLDRPLDTWLVALSDAGFSVKLDYEQPNFRVYALMPPR